MLCHFLFQFKSRAELMVVSRITPHWFQQAITMMLEKFLARTPQGHKLLAPDDMQADRVMSRPM
jgi:hypothetical protein